MNVPGRCTLSLGYYPTVNFYSIRARHLLTKHPNGVRTTSPRLRKTVPSLSSYLSVSRKGKTFMTEFFCCAHHARPAGYIITHVTVFILFVSRHTHLVEQPSMVTKGRGRSKPLLAPITFAGNDSH
jgi:hypothetical protein